MFSIIISTFDMLGFSVGDIDAIWSVLAIILHLGKLSVRYKYNHNQSKDTIKLKYSSVLKDNNTMSIENITNILGLSSSNEFEELSIDFPLLLNYVAIFESTIKNQIIIKLHKVMEWLYLSLINIILQTINKQHHDNNNIISNNKNKIK